MKWFVILAMAAGVFLTVRNIQGTPRALKRIQRKYRDLAQLHELYNATYEDEAALDQFNSLSSSRPKPIADMLKALIPGPDTTVTLSDAIPSAGGWQLLQASVTMSEVPLGKAVAFMDNAARERPPWWMRECRITATEGKRGHARVELKMEALSKGN